MYEAFSYIFVSDVINMAFRLASLLFTLQLLTRARKVSGTKPWLHPGFDVPSKVDSMANISFLNVCIKSIISSLLLMKIICIAFLIFKLNISSRFVSLSLKSKLTIFSFRLLLYWLFQINFDLLFLQSVWIHKVFEHWSYLIATEIFYAGKSLNAQNAIFFAFLVVCHLLGKRLPKTEVQASHTGERKKYGN